MIYRTDLESYNKKLEKGIAKLNSYKNAMVILAALTLIASIVLLGVTYMDIKALFPELALNSLDNFMTAASNPDIQMQGYASAGGFLLSAIFMFSHGKMLESRFTYYIENIHPRILSEHKDIFQDHSDEAIDAFREERNKDKILHILETYNGHITFILANYNNFNKDD